MTSIQSWARDVIELIPTDPDGPDFTFTTAVIPPVTQPLECNALVIERGHHDYDTWRIDYPQCSGTPHSYACLSLAILAALLHRHDRVNIALTSPRSDIRSITIVQPSTSDYHTGLDVRPAALHYSPTPVSRHPWVKDAILPADLPWFKLTNAEDFVATEQHRAERDCIHGFGSLLGTARFARLLLDLSRPSNRTFEVALECEAGFRGVAPASAEIRLWLPGGDYWVEP